MDETEQSQEQTIQQDAEVPVIPENVEKQEKPKKKPRSKKQVEAFKRMVEARKKKREEKLKEAGENKSEKPKTSSKKSANLLSTGSPKNDENVVVEDEPVDEPVEKAKPVEEESVDEPVEKEKSQQKLKSAGEKKSQKPKTSSKKSVSLLSTGSPKNDENVVVEEDEMDDDVPQIEDVAPPRRQTGRMMSAFSEYRTNSRVQSLSRPQRVSQIDPMLVDLAKRELIKARNNRMTKQSIRMNPAYFTASNNFR